MKSLLFLLLSLVVLFASCNTSNETSRFPELSGPFLGQTLPGDNPELFAPGIISTAMYERDIAIMPDGNEIYYCISTFGYNLIFYILGITTRYIKY